MSGPSALIEDPWVVSRASIDNVSSHTLTPSGLTRSISPERHVPARSTSSRDHHSDEERLAIPQESMNRGQQTIQEASCHRDDRARETQLQVPCGLAVPASWVDEARRTDMLSEKNFDRSSQPLDAAFLPSQSYSGPRREGLRAALMHWQRFNAEMSTMPYVTYSDSTGNDIESDPDSVSTVEDTEYALWQALGASPVSRDSVALLRSILDYLPAEVPIDARQVVEAWQASVRSAGQEPGREPTDGQATAMPVRRPLLRRSRRFERVADREARRFLD